MQKIKIMEIIDNLLWFPGYSTYLTDWCKMYLCLRIHSPNGLNSSDLIEIYTDILLVWYAHHQRHVNHAPLPPRLYHLELAYEYLKIYNSTDSYFSLPSKFQKEPTGIKGILIKLFKKS